MVVGTLRVGWVGERLGRVGEECLGRKKFLSCLHKECFCQMLCLFECVYSVTKAKSKVMSACLVLSCPPKNKMSFLCLIIKSGRLGKVGL